MLGMGECQLSEVGIPLDEEGRPWGFGVGAEAALRDWRADREEREYQELFRMLEAGTKVEASWRTQARARVASRKREGVRFRCALCGVPFFARSPRARFCSRPCQTKRARARRRPDQGTYRTGTRDRVLALLGERPWLKTREVCAALPEDKRCTVARALYDLKADGTLTTDGRPKGARYALAGTAQRRKG